MAPFPTDLETVRLAQPVSPAAPRRRSGPLLKASEEPFTQSSPVPTVEVSHPPSPNRAFLGMYTRLGAGWRQGQRVDDGEQWPGGRGTGSGPMIWSP